MTNVAWMWFGNQSQINGDSSTMNTQAEADGLVGYTANGPGQIKPVNLDGETRVNWDGDTPFFSASYHPHGAGASPFTYVSPSNNQTVTTQITSFFTVTYEIHLPDGTNRQETGVLIQMNNGDMFFRPARASVDDWDDITELRGVTVVSATPVDVGTYIATVSFHPDIFDINIVCFASGTLIRTAAGDLPVENLRPGMMILTRDHGLQPLRWCGQSRVDSAQLAANPKLRPIRIAAGALGENMPSVALSVSPQHRVMIGSVIAERMFDAPELLVPAKQLTDLPGVEIDEDVDSVTYHHLMFDAHEIVLSNNAATESLYPGAEAIKALSPEALAEIEALFPDLLTAGNAVSPARPFARGPKLRTLVQRHCMHNQPMIVSQDWQTGSAQAAEYSAAAAG